MASADQLRPHQTVRILTGKYAGSVGTVEHVTGQHARVQIAGIHNGEPVKASPMLRASQLEVQ